MKLKAITFLGYPCSTSTDGEIQSHVILSKQGISGGFLQTVISFLLKAIHNVFSSNRPVFVME